MPSGRILRTNGYQLTMAANPRHADIVYGTAMLGSVTHAPR